MIQISKSQGATIALAFVLACTITSLLPANERPNILIAISDDQSYPHASAYGYEAISTPAFDRVAKEGVLFRNAFTPAPGCSPMRAAFLTGRNIWQIEHAGTHASSFPTKYEVFPDRLEQAGYWVGYTGKGWAPGNWKISGRDRNPAGPQFSGRTMKSPSGISKTDYASNFADFLAQRPEGQPFCFWYGGHEPHRSFGRGIGRENGLEPAKVQVPAFLPDTEEVRDDILDYCFEIQWFDQHLERMLRALDQAGELAKTLVIVTSDNGMAFPRAKANVYEYGIHMPLAIAWADRMPGGRVVDDLVSLTDVTCTIYDAAGVAPPSDYPPAGRSLVEILSQASEGVVDASRDAIFAGRERHSSSRYHTLGYPQRCIRTQQYLYIRNFMPARWPAGAPQKYGKGGYAKNHEVIDRILGDPHGGYHDIDACPTLTYLIEQREDSTLGHYLNLAVDKRPAEELFDIQKDPACLENLADKGAYAGVRAELARRLTDYLKQTGDARVLDADGGHIWETYPRYSGLRWFPTPNWASENPAGVPEQPWLEERRPK